MKLIRELTYRCDMDNVNYHSPSTETLESLTADETWAHDIMVDEARDYNASGCEIEYDYLDLECIYYEDDADPMFDEPILRESVTIDAMDGGEL